ncbi:hypothetical protein [Microvirga subterranea]|uniref:Uncharacterized protein n=1 Tax=Microvirga subterranea TaxID=186651 RepID=A0A370HCL4_9HYPH|nr:hypothetical protein [Microvirga subterranea]RDI52603.1 hypothetical protein DES45_11464 [Microvirga subterranea]
MMPATTCIGSILRLVLPAAVVFVLLRHGPAPAKTEWALIVAITAALSLQVARRFTILLFGSGSRDED